MARMRRRSLTSMKLASPERITEKHGDLCLGGSHQFALNGMTIWSLLAKVLGERILQH